jgi:diacylglycerol kinase family enzyme
MAAARALSAVGEVTVRETERAGHARALAAEPGADAIVAMGGDGTVNEVVNGIPGGTPLGVVPAGASSVFARALGYPARQAPALRALVPAMAAGRVRRIGLGSARGRRFAFSAGFGLDAEVVRRVDVRRAAVASRRRPSDLRFAAEAVAALRASNWRLRPVMTVQADGHEPWRCSYLAVANQHPYTFLGPLPLRVTPRARFDLGLDAAAAGDLRPRQLWRIAVLGLVPLHAAYRDRRVAYFHDVRRIEVRCDRPVQMQLDGEYLGLVSEAGLEALPEALTVYVPERRSPLSLNAWRARPGRAGRRASPPR